MEQLPVAIAVMTAGDVRMETCESLLAAFVQQAAARIFLVQSGPYLDNGRNNTVKVFNDPRIRECCTHLLLVDSDISFTPEHVRALYEAAKTRAVVGGIYYSIYEGMPKPVVYDWTTNELGLKTMKVIEKWDDGWPLWFEKDPKDGLEKVVPVEAVGAGFLMIRYEVIDVLEKLHGDPQPWFSEPVIDGIHFGEDLAFCVRAKDAGFGVWAHRGVELLHHKMARWGPEPGSSVEP